jgi:hypothetical protein
LFGGSQDGQAGGIAVALKLASGETVKGELVTSMSGKLTDTINKPDPFLEIQRSDGTSVMIAKSAIAQIEKIEAPRTDQLNPKKSSQGILDPYVVLGVPKNANKLDIQAAYHALARKYHPDHFSGREMPQEVLQYVSGMFQRITMAYNELKDAADRSNAA